MSIENVTRLKVNGKWVKERTVFDCYHPLIKSVMLMGSLTPSGTENKLMIGISILYKDGVSRHDIWKPFENDMQTIEELFNEAEMYIENISDDTPVKPFDESFIYEHLNK